ncbi:hypothetical protein RKD21_002579 [Streptomyces albogriseolus]|uniref:Uncharacterized protein n=1 Tax=Streptomyces albogriseolus TaxID=1887 RepID=A0ACC6ULB9_STRAO
MSGFQRKGRWTAPRRFNCLAFWGGGEIDLREANFADREIVVNAVAIMGGIDVIVPPGVEVVVRGVGIMGGFDHREEGVPAEPGAPRVIVTGLAFWGGVGVQRKLPRAERERLREERRREKQALKEERRREHLEHAEEQRREHLDSAERHRREHLDSAERHRRELEESRRLHDPLNLHGPRRQHERRPEDG